MTKDPPRVSFEFFPPRSATMEENLWRAIAKLAPLEPLFVSVTYGAGGSTRERTHGTVKRIVAETHLLPAAHLTCVAASRDDVNEVARSYWAAGVRHIVALRGDPTEGVGAKFVPHPQGYATSAALVAGLKALAPFEISVGCYPEGHPESTRAGQDIDALKAKVDAGASRAITQFFFAPDAFLRFRDRAVKAGVEIPIVPGIMPIANFKNVCSFAGKAGASVPESLHELYAGLDEDPETLKLISATVAAELCLALRKEGVEDFHFYTLNRPDLTFAVCRLLGLHPRPAISGGPSEHAR